MLDTTMMTAAAHAMMRQAAVVQGTDPDSSAAQFIPPTVLADRIRIFGPGVRLVSSERIDTNGYGFVARYEIDDINTFRFRLHNPAERVRPMSKPDDEPSFRFAMKDGTLTIHTIPFFEEELGADSKEFDAESIGPGLVGMGDVARDFTVRLMVGLDGGIASTDATYRDADRVAILDVAIQPLLDTIQKDPAGFADRSKALKGVPPGERMRAFHGVAPSVRIEEKPTVTIR